MDIQKALVERGCLIWPDTQYASAVINADRSSFLYQKTVPEVLIGIYPRKSKLIAVYPIASTEMINKDNDSVYNFLDLINDRGGIGFIVVQNKDIQWHLNLENWKHLVDTENGYRHMGYKFNKLMRVKLGVSVLSRIEEYTYLELVDCVFSHREYDIYSCLNSLRFQETLELYCIYKQFLKWYREILTEIFKDFRDERA